MELDRLDDMASVLLQIADGFPDHLEVFIGLGLDDLEHMEQPGLPENRDDRCFGAEEQIHLRILGDLNPFSPG